MKKYNIFSCHRLLALVLAMAMLLPLVTPAIPASAEEAVTASSAQQAEVTVTQAAERRYVWDFASSAQLNDFTLYQSATSQFALTDGTLAPNGTDGEMKAIITDMPENIKSVSVDIIPGDSGVIVGGLYFGASDAAAGRDIINSQIIIIQSNYTAWSDAPNRVDIIRGSFTTEGGWEYYDTMVSESGNGNALFSGGNKQPLTLKLSFIEDAVLVTLSLRDNSAKYIQVVYEMDEAAMLGQIGLRSSYSDTRYDNLTIEYEQPLTEYQKLWDFSDAAQAEDFTFYANGTNSFSVTDGMLKPDGGNGEMKAIFNEDIANIASISVDILPGASGLMNSGIYIGARNVAAGQDLVDAVCLFVESMFTGWDDAPNRIDLWLGQFNQGWGGQIAGTRMISETGRNNALYTDGIKKPLTLQLDFAQTTLTATLSLQENPNRYVQTSWELTAEQLTGQIGLRDQYIDQCYDNFIITYKEPVETTPVTEQVYTNDGSSFCDINLRPWKLTKDLTATPYTLEAWVLVPEDANDNATGYIVGNASRAPSVSMLMGSNGSLCLTYGMENADMTVTTLNFDVDTDLRTNKWTHVAYTCDVASDTVVAYINGEAVNTWTDAGLKAISIPDHITPSNTFAIGSRDSSDDAKNKFVGKIADVRMWDRALSAEQISTSMLTQYTASQEGLLFNAPLDGAEDGVYADLSGNENTVQLFDTMLDLQTEEHEPGSYSIVVIPDQQILNNYYPEKLMNMYQWIVDNRETENIQMVLNVGDMADFCGKVENWENTKAAVELLGDLPFIAAPGNHDYDTDSGWNKGYGVRDQLTMMNEYLPQSLFEGYSTEIGFFDEVNSANQWQAFEVNGNKYMVIALEYVPQDDVIAWANEVVSAHPNHQVILLTHNYVGSYGNLNVPKLWSDFVSKHDNIIMAFSGHVWHTHVVRRTDTGVDGNKVHQMLMDAQVTDTGNEGLKHVGMLGILRFNADGTQCQVSYYSTDRDMYDAGSNFTLTLPAQDKEYIVQADGKSYTTVTEAVANANGKVIKLLKTIDEQVQINTDAIIDLAGFTLADVTVADGVTLTLIDSATDDYEGAYGSATVTGGVAAFAEVDGKTYMTVCESGVYSAHRYDVAITHISLDASRDALGYKARLYGDEVVSSHLTGIGFKLWLDGKPARTFTTTGKQQVTLRLKEILKSGGGQTNINATAFVTLTTQAEAHTEISACQSTTMRKTLETVNSAWDSYSQAQTGAVKALCDAYYDETAFWGLYNVYPIDVYGDVSAVYTAVSGSHTAITGSGCVVEEGKLHMSNTGEGKAILRQVVEGDKTISVDLYPGADSKAFNSAVYLGASNAHAPQDSISGVAVILESYFPDIANRMDIIIGSFPSWQEHHRFVIEGANALFTDNVAEPVNLTIKLEGNVITATVSVLSDPTKSATTSYTYTGSYDLSAGQVGLRALYNDMCFDNFKVVSADEEVSFDFDDADTSGLQLLHSACVNGAKTAANGTLALHKYATFTDGTLAASINTAGKYQAGIVFGADEAATSYYLFRLCDNQYVELVKVVDGAETVLDRGYLSAGHIYTNYNRLEVIKDGNTISCYYYNRFGKVNCYACCQDENALTGDRFGFYAANAGTKIGDVTVTDNVQLPTAEVLIFGHSYTEMWHQYQTYFPEYEDIDNIGIGGSVAVHWEALADEVITYQPKLGIYNIGINDLTGGTPPKAIVESMENALLQIKQALPEFEVVLVSVSHCPARSTITDTISETNALMRNLAASYDWMYYAEAEYLFCSDAADPLSTIASLFIDNLHPSAEGYRLMAEVIKAAIRGENQPEYDEELAERYLNQMKQNLLAFMDMYGENAYSAENWVSAEPYYTAAVEKINACATEAELEALDLSQELDGLNAITNNGANIVSNLTNAETRDEYIGGTWEKKDDNTVHVGGYGYALDNTAAYSDTDFVVNLSGNTGDIATGGIFLRATSMDNKGIKGYLINFVSNPNYLQVYYVDNCYNNDGSAFTVQYIGGVVYGNYGQLMDTDFYFRAEGDTLYISTVDRELAGLEPLTIVDLTYGGQFELIESGYMGMLAWNSGVEYDITLKNFAGA